MTFHRAAKFVRVGLFLAIAFGSLTTIAPKPAQAANSQCVPAIVEYSGGQLLVQCNNINHFAQISPAPACSGFTQTADTLKAWLSLAQAALLAGKNVNLYHTACGGLNMLTAVDLIR